MIAVLAPGRGAPPSPASEPLTVAATSPARLPKGPQILASQTRSLIVCKHILPCPHPLRLGWTRSVRLGERSKGSSPASLAVIIERTSQPALMPSSPGFLLNPAPGRSRAPSPLLWAVGELPRVDVAYPHAQLSPALGGGRTQTPAGVWIALHPAWDPAPWRCTVDPGWIGLKIASTKRGAQSGIANN